MSQQRFINGKPVIRCSSLNQLLSCPGSRTLVELIGETRDDDRDSWEGQWCHYKAAKRFVDKNGAMAPECGLVGPDIPKGWEPAQPGIANWIVDFYHRAVMEDTPGDWAMEVESEMLFEFGAFWLSGHVDVDAVAPDATAVNFDDLKSGINYVDAAECNWQILGYAVLFKRRWESLTRVRGRIIQPRITEEIGPRITEAIIDGEQLANACGFLESKITAALESPMELETGPKQCRWCPAWQQCPAMIAELNLMKLTLTAEALAEIKANPDDRILVQWGVAKKLLEPKLKKAGDMLKERLAAPGAPAMLEHEGAKAMLTPWKGAREFSDTGKVTAWEVLSEQLDADHAYGCMSLSPPEIEKAYAAQFNLPHESKDKDSGKKRFENIFAGLWEQKTGQQLTIVV